MGVDFGIVYPLWLLDASGNELLDRVLGEIPLGHVTVPVVTGPVERFRWRGPDPHEFVTKGGWHFPPNAERYASRHVRPHPAEWFQRRNLLAKLVKELEKRSLPWLAWIDLRSVAALAEQAPHLAHVNAWGEPVPHRGPCVLQPELGDLLQALLAELREYGAAGIELLRWNILPLSDFLGHWAFPAHVAELLGTCFCSACKRAASLAGIDSEEVQRTAQAMLERSQPSHLGQKGEVEGMSPLVLKYQKLREHNADAWLSNIGKQSAPPQKFIIRLSGQLTRDFDQAPPGWRALRWGSDPAPHYDTNPPYADAYAFYAWRQSFKSSDELVAKVHAMATRGTTFVDFDGIDEGGEEALDWIRRAVRFANRDTSAG